MSIKTWFFVALSKETKNSTSLENRINDDSILRVDIRKEVISIGPIGHSYFAQIQKNGKQKLNEQDLNP